MKNKQNNSTKEDWDSVESPPLSDKQLSQMKHIKESHPDIPKRVRGLQIEPLKVPVSVRLSPDVVEYFKSQGKGWQTRINNILHNYMKTHEYDTTR